MTDEGEGCRVATAVGVAVEVVPVVREGREIAVTTGLVVVVLVSRCYSCCHCRCCCCCCCCCKCAWNKWILQKRLRLIGLAPLEQTKEALL